MNKRKKKKFESARLARQRAEDIMNTTNEEVKKRDIEMLESNKNTHNLDDLFDSKEDMDMFSFGDSEDTEEGRSVQDLDIFDGVSDNDSMDGSDPSVDEQFKNLYSEESENYVGVDADENNSIEDLESENEQLDEQIETEEEEEEQEQVQGKVADPSTLYMALQVFDSAEEDFDLNKVDNQMVFDTDDESLYDLGFNNKKEDSEDKLDEPIFDSSEM